MTWTRVVVWIVIVCFLLVLVAHNVLRTLHGPRGHGAARTVVEIGQLQSAMRFYEEKYDEFPPCLADANTSDRKVRFMKHLKKAFEHSAYGESEQAFDRLNLELQKGIRSTLQAYNFLDPVGTIRALDLNTLDAAESLVFWLGGFPTPYNDQTKAVIANRRIFGFHRDAEAPMRRDAPGTEGLDPLRYRTEPIYQFDEYRLVDQDRDGWLEYVPRPYVDSKPTAPFVYFDAKCYVDSGTKPNSLGKVRYPADTVIAKQFGFAVPYAASFAPSTSAIAWQHPESFQIVCGGLDGMYDTSAETGEEKRIVVMPVGEVYGVPFERQSALSIEESDNLTNLSSNTLEGMRQESGR